jgi:hypothetical protein
MSRHCQPFILLSLTQDEPYQRKKLQILLALGQRGWPDKLRVGMRGGRKHAKTSELLRRYVQTAKNTSNPHADVAATDDRGQELRREKPLLGSSQLVESVLKFPGAHEKPRASLGSVAVVPKGH